jgi:hypothetical protein
MFTKARTFLLSMLFALHYSQYRPFACQLPTTKTMCCYQRTQDHPAHVRESGPWGVEPDLQDISFSTPSLRFGELRESVIPRSSKSLEITPAVSRGDSETRLNSHERPHRAVVVNEFDVYALRHLLFQPAFWFQGGSVNWYGIGGSAPIFHGEVDVQTSQSREADGAALLTLIDHLVSGQGLRT